MKEIYEKIDIVIETIAENDVITTSSFSVEDFEHDNSFTDIDNLIDLE